MKQISKNSYNKMSKDYKGIYSDFQGNNPEWKGKRTVLTLDKETQATVLLIEGVSFEIVDKILPGDTFKINKLTCGDEDLLNWYEEQFSETLRVETVEEDVNGVWVKNCPYRIDIDEILI